MFIITKRGPFSKQSYWLKVFTTARLKFNDLWLPKQETVLRK